MRKLFSILLIVSLLSSLTMATSLWSSSSNKKFKSLFVMKVASEVGDTLNVMVYDNTTASYSYSNPNYKGGLLSVLVGLLKSVTNFDLTKFIPINSSTTIDTSKSSSKNQSQFVTQIAAVITKVEPNGNFLIKGSKEVKVGQSMKQVQIEGIVNPNDISQDNTVDSSKIADLKIWYDGSLVFQQGMNEDRWINWIFSSLSSILF
ncbi:flagellar basal body L-ring protein FlgH [Mesoaciditoga lauensis]|uniref:flagellar basal body L-ring protein FlgH n=1 Tax=Mesoaciditoga lauensis TaxID=1495039 RepID=UPI0005654D12|nr:flagellar basal body L-ring protein FlgH [Mesoaciditoga lauensis]